MFAREAAVRSPEPGLQVANGAVRAGHHLVGIAAGKQVSSLAEWAVVISQAGQGQVGRPSIVWTVAPGLTLAVTKPVRLLLDASSITCIRTRPEPAPRTSTATTTSSLSPKKRPSRPACGPPTNDSSTSTGPWRRVCRKPTCVNLVRRLGSIRGVNLPIGRGERFGRHSRGAMVHRAFLHSLTGKVNREGTPLFMSTPEVQLASEFPHITTLALLQLSRSAALWCPNGPVTTVAVVLALRIGATWGER